MKITGQISILVILFLAACAPISESIPTETQTKAPTFTPTSTSTSTSTPLPTETSIPTPTVTPIGRSSGKIIFWQLEENKTGDSNKDEGFYSVRLLDLSTMEEEVLLESNGVDTGATCESVSIDGKFAYCSIDKIQQTTKGIGWNSILYKVNLKTKEISKLSMLPQFSGNDDAEDLALERRPDISNDNNLLVFDSNREYLNSTSSIRYLYKYNLDTFSIERILGTQQDAIRARISPDGSTIAYMAYDNHDWEIYTIGINGENLKQITTNTFTDRFPSWSPDGTKLVFHSDMDGNIELYLYEIQTEETTRLTFNPALDVSADWSPDGNWILFSSDRDGDMDIYMLNLKDLSEIKVLDKEGSQGVPLWVP